MYNPFVPFTDVILRQLLRDGHYMFVVQRFTWPLIERGKGFMVSPYRETDEAYAHASNLAENEGKLLDARKDLDKLESLVAKGSAYRLFLNMFREERWKNKMLQTYEKAIINYLRARTPFQRKDTIDITFSLQYGRVIAAITNGERTITVRAVELIS